MSNNRGIGAAIAGSTMGTTDRERSHLDFYPTPKEGTLALLRSRHGPIRSKDVHECACGSMDMANVMSEEGFTVVSSDIVTGVNFLELSNPMAPQIMTNPPFDLAAEFIQKAHDLNVEYLAMLLKMTFWNAVKREPLFRSCPLTAVLPLTWRLDFLGKGAPTMDMAWYVWHPSNPPRTVEYDLLLKPR